MEIVYISFIVSSLLLFVLGGLVKYKKATWLISGYNIASKEKKAEYDIDKLCHHVGNFALSIAATWSIVTLLVIIFSTYMEMIIVIGSSVLLIVVVAGLIYLNTNNRVKK